jgi:hypothetical protein
MFNKSQNLNKSGNEFPNFFREKETIKIQDLLTNAFMKGQCGDSSSKSQGDFMKASSNQNIHTNHNQFVNYNKESNNNNHNLNF